MVLGCALRNESRSLVLCQELDGSGLLSVSKTMLL